MKDTIHVKGDRLLGERNVFLDGERLTPEASQKVWRHSPDGFEWGYGGSGPAQLALAILLAAGMPDDQAVRHHQAFKFAFLAGLPHDEFNIAIDLKAWVKKARLR
jgi:Family of unknown function (DUF6166)